MPDNTINRFKKAQEHSYHRAKKELLEGEKQSHWMWYMFPQLKGLGYSSDAEYYGIKDIAEAREFLADTVLKNRLLELCKILLSLPEDNPVDILGHIDALKLRSSMTLFEAAEPTCSIFHDVLNKFYGGEPDKQTLQLLSGE